MSNYKKQMNDIEKFDSQIFLLTIEMILPVIGMVMTLIDFKPKFFLYLVWFVVVAGYTINLYNKKCDQEFINEMNIRKLHQNHDEYVRIEKERSEKIYKDFKESLIKDGLIHEDEE